MATVPVAPPPLMVTPSVPVLEKKPDGYVSVMLPPFASAPPALVVNESVAATGVLPATRSDAAIANDAFVTWPPMTPELMPTDAVTSALVAMVTPVAFPAVAPPMVRPVTVTVTALLAAIA